MNKQGMAWFIIPIALITLVGAFLILQAAGLLAIGWSTLSMSEVSFESNNADVGGDAFLLTVVQNGAAQHAVGTFDITADGKTAQKDFTLELDHKEQQCYYDLQTNGQTIKQAETLDSGTLTTSWNINNKRDDCWALGGDLFVNENGVSNIEYRCIQYKTIGIAGNIVLDRLTFTTDLIGEIEGESRSTATISNTGQRTASIYGGDVVATWQGSLTSGEVCPSSAEHGVMAAYRYSTSGPDIGWTITNRDAYEEYENEYATFENCLANAAQKVGGYSISGCVGDLNYAALAAMETDSFANGDRYGSGTISSGNYDIQLNKLIMFPMITMKIKASRLGIFIPVGIPKITGVDAPDFGTGDTGNVAVTFRNDADVTAAFDVDINCPEPFSVQGTTPRLQVSGGGRSTINIAMSGDSETANKECSTCTVTVSDAEEPSSKDTEDFRLCVTKITPPCEDGALKCTGEVQYLCQAGEWEPTGSSECTTTPPPKPDRTLLYKAIAAFLLLLGTGMFGALAIMKENPLLKVLFGALCIASFIGLVVIAFTLFSGFAVWSVTIGIVFTIIGLLMLIKGLPFGTWVLIIGLLLLIIGALIGVSILYGQAKNTPLWLQILKR